MKVFLSILLPHVAVSSTYIVVVTEGDGVVAPFQSPS